MNAVTDEVDAPKFSDAEFSGLLEQATEVLTTVVKGNEENKNTSRGSIL